MAPGVRVDATQYPMMDTHVTWAHGRARGDALPYAIPKPSLYDGKRFGEHVRITRENKVLADRIRRAKSHYSLRVRASRRQRRLRGPPSRTMRRPTPCRSGSRARGRARKSPAACRATAPRRPCSPTGRCDQRLKAGLATGSPATAAHITAPARQRPLGAGARIRPPRRAGAAPVTRASALCEAPPCRSGPRANRREGAAANSGSRRRHRHRRRRLPLLARLRRRRGRRSGRRDTPLRPPSPTWRGSHNST